MHNSWVVVNAVVAPPADQPEQPEQWDALLVDQKDNLYIQSLNSVFLAPVGNGTVKIGVVDIVDLLQSMTLAVQQLQPLSGIQPRA